MTIANMSCNEDPFPVGTIDVIVISVAHTTMQNVLEIKNVNAEQDRATIRFNSMFHCYKVIVYILLPLRLFPLTPKGIRPR